MRQMLLSFVLVVPIASAAWAQPSPSPRPQPDAGAVDPHQIPPQEQVPDLQLLPPPGLGDVPPKGPPDSNPVKPPQTDEQLLAKLSKAPDQRGARAIERELKARWAHSESPSASLLLKRADQAMEAHDFDTAREIAQKLTTIAPN